MIFADSFAVDRDVPSLIRRYGRNMQTQGISYGQEGYEGGSSIQFSSVGPNNFETLDALTPAGDEIVMSIRVYANRPRLSRLFVASLNGTAQLEIWFARPTFASEKFFLRFFAGQTLIHETRVLDEDIWHQIEIVASIHPTVGTLTVRVDRVVEFQASNIRTSAINAAGWNGVGLGGYAQDFRGYIRLADFVVSDTTADIAGDRTTGFMGDVIVEAIHPQGDSFINTATPSAGSDHYAMVDDGLFAGTVDDDGSYLEAQAALTYDIELFEMTPLKRIRGAVLSVHASSDIKMDSGVASHFHIVGEPVAQQMAIPSSNLFFFVSSTSYVRRWRCYQSNFFNPVKPWTRDDVVSMHWGYASLIASQPRVTRFFVEVVGHRHRTVDPLPLI